MVDATARKLRVPPRFMAYMESNRIYELFHEMACELVIHRPHDHISFLRDSLEYIENKRDTPRIILIGPPHFDKRRIADIVALKLDVKVIQLSDIQLSSSSFKKIGDLDEMNMHPNIVLKGLVAYLKSDFMRGKGWILTDYPTTYQDAVTLQRAGILPTHTIQLIPTDFDIRSSAQSFTGVLKKENVPCNLAEDLKKYRRNLLALREAYRFTWKECEVRGRPLAAVAEVVAQLSRRQRERGAPLVPRVALVGPRGSGRRVQARMLSDRFGIVHVKTSYIIQQAKLQHNEIANQLKEYETRAAKLPTKLIAKIVEERLLQTDCLDKGWVITGFPKNAEEMKAFDLMDTPPNRVIFLLGKIGVFAERLLGRTMNMISGSEHHISESPSLRTKQLLKVHPKDNPIKVMADLQEYEAARPQLQEYCGRTGVPVDASQDVGKVFEYVSAAVLSPAPGGRPRNFRPAQRPLLGDDDEEAVEEELLEEASEEEEEEEPPTAVGCVCNEEIPVNLGEPAEK